QSGADPVLVEALLTDDRLLGDPQTLLDAITVAGDKGLTARFYKVAGAKDPELLSSVSTDADMALKDKDGKPLKPAEANSVRFEGYLKVPSHGAYRFYVTLGKKDTQVELRFEHWP